jgi:diphthamide biosynthesis protein 7
MAASHPPAYTPPRHDSYDEYIRLWDKRAIRRPLQELSLGGGVWRLRWHPERPTALIAACMYGGCRVLEATGMRHDLYAHDNINPY